MCKEEENTERNESTLKEINEKTTTEFSSKEKKYRVLYFTFDGDKEKDISLKQVTINSIIVGIVALAIYFPVELLCSCRILNSYYYFHVILSLITFVAVPCIYLIIFQLKTGKAKYFFISTTKGLQPKKIISSLAQGIGMHAGIFFPWIWLTQKYSTKVTEIKYHLPETIDWVYQLLFFALNVIMFEYYSKAYVQIQFSKAKGALKLFNGKLTIYGGRLLGFIMQNLVWLGGHVQEFLWLRNYLGGVNAVFFILVSGVLTGLTVMETENIFGVTVGHVLLNVLTTIVYAN